MSKDGPFLPVGKLDFKGGIFQMKKRYYNIFKISLDSVFTFTLEH